MEATSYFRVERGGQSFGSNGRSYENRQHQKRQKFHALVDAIGAVNLSQARQLLQSLFNLEPMLRSDPVFLRLGQALEDGNVHAAEHFVKEVRDKALVALLGRVTTRQMESRKPVGHERHFVDLQA